MQLSEVSPQNQVKVTAFSDEDLELKLLEFGINIGTQITIDRKAPLGGPILVITQNGKLALRKEEAATISVALL